jgi:hypothetical protein
MKSDGERGPLIILGGGREAEKKNGYEVGTTDDSVLNEKVGKALRGFLPQVFPGWYEEGKEPEWEWVRFHIHEKESSKMRLIFLVIRLVS